jgi:hypothetical protein
MALTLSKSTYTMLRHLRLDAHTQTTKKATEKSGAFFVTVKALVKASTKFPYGNFIFPILWLDIISAGGMFMNNAALKHEYYEASSTYKHSTSGGNDNSYESIEKTAVRYRLIARQSEEACHLKGNICGPDLGYFEEKYGICDFV